MKPAGRSQRTLPLLDAMAERKISEAQARGEFEDLPGRGEPLKLEDDALVPEELRAGYRLLKNAGYLPPEIAHCSEVRDIEALLLQARTGEERDTLLSRMHWLLMRGNAGRNARSLRVADDYATRLAERLARRRNTG